MLKKHENEVMNILKAFAIILMVMGHAESPLNNYLYLFHLATFIFVSGYFYNEKYDKNFLLLVNNRIKSLYIPYIKYVLIFTILNNILFKINLVGKEIEFNKESITRIFKGIVTFNAPIDTLGAFWFIKTLFLCTILFGLISFLIKKIFIKNFEWFRALLVVIIFLIGNIILNEYGSVSMQNVVKVSMCIPIFYFGVLYKIYGEKIKNNNFLVTICIIILFISGNQGKIDIANGIYTNAAFFITNSILGIYVLLNLANKLKEIDKYKFLNYIGKNTLPILASHWICFKLADNFFYIENSSSRWAIYTVFGICIPLIIDILVKKIKNVICKF